MNKYIVAILLILLCGSALGQGASPYIGKWGVDGDSLYIKKGDSIYFIVGDSTVIVSPAGIYWEPDTVLCRALLDSIVTGLGRFAPGGGGGTSDSMQADTSGSADYAKIYGTSGYAFTLREGRAVDFTADNETLYVGVDTGVLYNWLGQHTFQNLVYLDDGATDSPSLIFRDEDNKYFSLIKYDDGHGSLFNNEGAIWFRFSNDANDYIYMDTFSPNVPMISTGGDCDLVINASSGEISFGNENLTTTGTLDAGATSVTGNIAVSGTVDGVDIAAFNTDVAGDSANWNTAYGWGNHSTQNYLDNDNANVDTAHWNAAWVWGDHSAQNYLDVDDANVDTTKWRQAYDSSQQLDNLRAEMDDSVTTTNVDAAGAVMNTDFDATTFLYAEADNTPLALNPAEVRLKLNVESGATADQTDEEIEDIVGGMDDGTETRISFAYNDGNDNFDLVVDNMTWLWADSGGGARYWVDSSNYAIYADTAGVFVTEYENLNVIGDFSVHGNLIQWNRAHRTNIEDARFIRPPFKTTDTSSHLVTCPTYPGLAYGGVDYDDSCTHVHVGRVYVPDGYKSPGDTLDEYGWKELMVTTPLTKKSGYLRKPLSLCQQ